MNIFFRFSYFLVFLFSFHFLFAKISFEEPLDGINWYKELNDKALKINKERNPKEKKAFIKRLNKLQQEDIVYEFQREKSKPDFSVTKYFLEAKDPLETFQYSIEKLNKNSCCFEKIYSHIKKCYSHSFLHLMAEACTKGLIAENSEVAVRNYLQQEIECPTNEIYTLVDHSINENELVAVMFLSQFSSYSKLIFLLSRKPNYSHLSIGTLMLNYLKKHAPGRYILSTNMNSKLETFYKKYGFKKDCVLTERYRHLYQDQVILTGVLSE